MKWKRIASVMLAGYMAFSAVPAMAVEDVSSDEAEIVETEQVANIVEVPEEIAETTAVPAVEDLSNAVSGSCGQNLTWKLDDAGTLTIKGSGAMGTDAGKAWTSRTDAPWHNYRSQIKKIVMSDGVTTICDYAFVDCTSLTTVDMSEGMQTIGYNAFYACSALTSIEITKNVTYIGVGAFSKCTALETVYFNSQKYDESVSTVCWNNAGKNAATSTLYFGDGVTAIPNYMFQGAGFKYIDISDSVKTIGKKTFSECTSLKKVTGGDGVETIKYMAFFYCNSLLEITIPKSVKTIEYEAFFRCENVWKINYNAVNCNDYTTSNAYSAFNCVGNNTTGVTLVVGEGVLRIPANMFGGTYNASTPYIDPPKIAYISLPLSLREIGSNAFKNCKYFTEITFPERLTYLDDSAFVGCSSLANIMFRGNPPTFHAKAFNGLDSKAYHPRNSSSWTDSDRGQYGAYQIIWGSWEPQNVQTPGVDTIYKDISWNQWYLPYVQYVHDNGLMGAVDSVPNFAPNSQLTRAMVAQILYAKEGKPSVSGSSKFSDVKKGDWFYNAVIWANKTGVVSGYSGGTFQPYTYVTREQLAVMLYAHAGRPAVSGSLSSYADYQKVDDWAVTAMTWAVKEGIISGSISNGKTYLNPLGNATRAQAATMLMQYFS